MSFPAAQATPGYRMAELTFLLVLQKASSCFFLRCDKAAAVEWGDNNQKKKKKKTTSLPPSPSCLLPFRSFFLDWGVLRAVTIRQTHEVAPLSSSLTRKIQRPRRQTNIRPSAAVTVPETFCGTDTIRGTVWILHLVYYKHWPAIASYQVMRVFMH